MLTVDEIPRGLCGCGCGGPTERSKQTSAKRGLVKGQPRRFIFGHHVRGQNHYKWKEGRTKTKAGYIKVRMPDHPRADDQGRVFEHILAVEKAIGHFLPPEAEVHHIDENPSNNRNNNLVVCPTHEYHMLLHRRLNALRACGNADYRQCMRCKKHDDPQIMAPHSSIAMVHPDCRKKYMKQYHALAPQQGKAAA
jgi:hypothetical protein